jgi:hypothetical protein
MSSDFCYACKSVSEIVYTDESNRDYCTKCAADLPIPSEVYGLVYLARTVPFQVGDKVECRTAGELYDGDGEVVEVSMDEEKGGGSLIYPAFRVRLDQKAENFLPDELYYTECCLRRKTESRN